MIREPDHLVAEIRSALDHGDALRAYDLAHHACDAFPGDRRFQYLQALALATWGSPADALEAYRSAALDAIEDEDIASLEGRLLKDLALAAPHPSIRASLAERAAQRYERAHATGSGYFPAINVATLKLLAGDRLAAQHWAERAATRAMSTLLAVLSDTDAFHRHATVAEAALIGGDLERTRQALSEIQSLADVPPRSIARTRDQLGLVATLQDLPTDWIDQSLSLPPVIALVGTLPEGIDSHACRFPAEAVTAFVGTAIGSTELVSTAGIKLRRPPAHVDWSGHTHTPEPAKLMRGSEVPTPHPHGLLSALSDRMVLGVAARRAAMLSTRLIACTPSGTFEILQSELAARAARPLGSSRLAAILFADLQDYSRLDDAGALAYANLVLPRIADVVGLPRNDVLLAKTWGDGLLLVIDNVPAALEIAMAIRSLFSQAMTDVPDMIAGLGVRVGIHYGPMFRITDPIEQRDSVVGNALTFAARIEPITPRNTVFVSAAVVAEAEITCRGRWRFEYVGRVALPKSQGVHRLYKPVQT